LNVGDRVRLKPSVGQPRWDWPDSQARNAVATIARFDGDGDPRLEFPSGPEDWAMQRHEIELVGDFPPP
jgi:hypothetical protein